MNRHRESGKSMVGHSNLWMSKLWTWNIDTIASYWRNRKSKKKERCILHNFLFRYMIKISISYDKKMLSNKKDSIYIIKFCSIFFWWSWRGSNSRPPPCHGGALPVELQPQKSVLKFLKQRNYILQSNFSQAFLFYYY